MEERSDILYRKSIAIHKWLENKIMEFVESQKRRIENKEIVAGTLKNYVKVIRLFCQMNEIENLVLWKKVKVGMPKVKESADDRAPTIEEIRKLVEYSSDMRVKVIVTVMVSSGIRVGAWDYLKWKHVTALRDENERLVAEK